MSDQFIPYVKPEDRDPRYHLFTKKFYCRVPNLQTRSMDHVKFFGTPTSGDSRFDQQMAKEVVDRYLTIVQMIDFYNDGIGIAVKHYKDSEVIYQHIVDHLKMWELKLIQEGDIHPTVAQDLILMDKFAKVVYDKAKYLKKNDQFVDSLLLRNVEQVFDLSPDELLPHPDAKTHVVDDLGEKVERYPEYNSMAQAFADATPARVRRPTQPNGHKTRFGKTSEKDFELEGGGVSARWGGG